MDKSQSVPWMVTIFRGDEQYTVPIWVAMTVHFRTPEWLVRRGEVLSDAQLLAEGVEAGDIVCPDLTWEALSGELSRELGQGGSVAGPTGDLRFELPPGVYAELIKLFWPWWRRWFERELPVELPPGPDDYRALLQRGLAAAPSRPIPWVLVTPAALNLYVESYVSRWIAQGFLGPVPHVGPVLNPAALNPQPLPPSALDLVPAALRRAVVGLTGLAVAEATAGEVGEEALNRHFAALSRALEDCGTPPRRRDPLGRPRRPFPPRKVLSDLAALLPEGRVQVEVSRAAFELSERTIG